jgi:hypothetical protein
MEKLIALLFFAAFLILLFFFQKSGFVSNINYILNGNYNNNGCSRENRVYPSGKIPGSYLGLTQAERENLLKLFINDNKNNFT